MYVSGVLSLICTLAAFAQPEPPTIAPDPVVMLTEAALHQPERFTQLIRIENSANWPGEARLSIMLHRDTRDGTTYTGVELPEVRFFHEPGILRAERTGDGNHAVVFEQTTDRDFVGSMTGLAPLWPMPHVWNATEDGVVLDPALGLIEFDRAEWTERGVRLHGETPSGTVRVQYDEDSKRITELTATLQDGWIRCTYIPCPAEPIDVWRIERDGRWVVRRLNQLSRAQSPITPGQTLANLTLLTPEYIGVRLEEIQNEEHIHRSGPWAVLLIMRADADQAMYDLAGEVARQTWAAAAEEIAGLQPADLGRYWLGHRAIIVAVTGDLDILPGRVREIAALAPAGVPTLISTQPEMTLDRLEDSYALSAIIVDPALTVGGVVSIENAETGVPAILDIMRSYSRPSSVESDDAQELDAPAALNEAERPD